MSNLQMTIAKNNFNMGLVSRLLEHRHDYAPIKNSVRVCDNMYIDAFGTTHMRGGTSVLLGPNFPPTDVLDIDKSFEIPFNSLNGNFSLCFYIRVVADASNTTYWHTLKIFKNTTQVFSTSIEALTVANGQPEPTGYLSDAYTINDILKFKYQQSGDAVYIVHPDKLILKVQRIADDNWTTTFLDLPSLSSYRLINVNMTLTIATNTLNISALQPQFATVVQAGMYIRMFVDDIEYTWEAGKSAAAGAVVIYAGNFYKNMTGAATTGTIPPTHTYGTVSDGSIQWKYIHSGYVDLKIETVSNNGYTCTVSYLDSNAVQSSDTTLTSTKMRFTGLKYVGKPTAIGIYNNRMVLGINSIIDGPKLFLSKSGDFENYDVLEYGDVTDASGIDLPIADASATILWISVADTLYVGTSNSIVVVKPITTSDVLSTNNITSTKVSDEGTNGVQPVRIDDDILYINALGNKILKIGYNIEVDGLQEDDISFALEEHKIAPITSMAKVDFPIKQIMFTMYKSNKILCLTYNKIQKIQAFYTYTTQAIYIKQVVGINMANYGFVPHQLVCRGTDPNVYSFIEYFDNENSCFDCKGLLSLSYDAETEKTTTSVEYGLFKGLTVGCISNTKEDQLHVITNVIESIEFNGEIVSKNIGLHFEAVIEPMPTHIPDIEGSCMVVNRQRINNIIMVVDKTTCFKHSSDNETFTPVEFTDKKEMSGEVKIDWNGADTENIIKEVNNIYTSGARIIIKQDRPFRMNIIALYVQIRVSGAE